MAPRVPGPLPDDLLERLARVEEQLHSVAAAVERLATRDTDLDQGMRALAERVQSGLLAQAQEFREMIERLSGKYASREDLAMIKGLLVAAFGSLSAFAFHRITGHG